MATLNTKNTKVTTKSRVDNLYDFFISNTESIYDKFGTGPKDIVVKKLFDINDTYIKTIISTDIPKKSNGKLQVDPEKDIVDFGFTSGQFKIVYSFWKILVGDVDAPGVYVTEVSPSKTEVRILPLDNNSLEFKNFATTHLTDSEINNILDYIFNPSDEVLPHTGFDPVRIIETMSDEFKNGIYTFEREDANSVLEFEIYVSTVLPNKIENIISNTRQSTFNHIREHGLTNQDELKDIIRIEFKNNIRLVFEK